MDPGRWRQIEQLYHSALEAGPTQRDRVLTEACREDTDLRREVESLLAQVTSTEALADLSAWAAASELAAAHTILKPGDALGPYEILGLVGTGGMA
jgi:hypothetical protein